MKRIFVVFTLLCFCALFVSAQQSVSIQKCEVIYQKEHLLYQDGDETNVIDVDLEWPSMMDFSDLKPLQTFLAKQLFDVDADQFDRAYLQFKSKYGIPVTAFATLPDDHKFNYITCELKEMGRVTNRYVSFSLSKKVEAGRDSKGESRSMSMLVTYDLIHQQVLTSKNILRSGSDEYALATLLLSHSLQGRPDGTLYGLQVSDACLGMDAILVQGAFLTADEAKPFLSVIPLSSMRNFLTKSCRKLLEMPIPARVPAPYSSDSLYQGVPIYNKVDQAPSFRGGASALRKYILDNITYPDEGDLKDHQGKVVASVLIDKEGFVRDVRIVDALSPAIDRDAVRILKGMPQWIPGEKDGHKVNVRISIPLSFREQ